MSKFLSVIFLAVSFIVLFSLLNFSWNYHFFLVQSGSMSPTINTGDVIITLPSKKYQVKDIITYKISNTPNITHRIVKIDGSSILTKGDANKTPDSSTVNKDQIVGKVFLIIPRLGYFIFFIKSIPGLITLIIIPSTIIIYQEIINIKKNFNKNIKS